MLDTKELAAMAIGSICVFSLLYLFLSLSELAILSAVRVVIVLCKVTFKVAVKTILISLQAIVLCLADSILRPLTPSMAVSLKFRTFQFCRTIWIAITQQPEEQVTDPTIYVYDPRGRTFQSFDPNWKPMLGEYKRKLAKKRHLQKIQHLRAQRYERTSLKTNIHRTIAAEDATNDNIPSPQIQMRPATSCWSTPPRQFMAGKNLASKAHKCRAGSPASLAATITDSDTDSHVSHRDMSFLGSEHESNELLCSNFTDAY